MPTVIESVCNGIATLVLPSGIKTTIDELDWPIVKNVPWSSRAKRNKHFSTTYVYSQKQFVPGVMMHRLITSCPQDMVVDHIDSNGLNNTRTNLRVVSHSSNNQNVRPIKILATGFIGVRINRHRFTAYIRRNGRVAYLGSFGTAEQAARKYDEAAIEIHGLGARTNFRVPGYSFPNFSFSE